MDKSNQKQRKASLLQNIAIMLCGLLLVALTLEMGLRVSGFIMLSLQEYKNLQAIEKKGSCRVICLGESTTQSQYPLYLEEILNKRNIGIEFNVIDKGLATTTTIAILLKLEADLDQYQPDIVVAMMGCNDWMTLYYQDIPDADTWLFKHCRVYRFSRLICMHILKKLKKEDIRSVNRLTLALIKNSYRNQNKPLDSEEYFKKAIEIKPKDDSAYLALGWFYKEQGRLIESEHAFNKAIELNPKNDSAYVGLGHVYRDQVSYPEAELVLKKAIKLNSQNDSAYAELGWLYRDQGRYAESEPMLNKAIELNPKNDLAYAELGRLYNNQKRYVESEQAFKEVIRLNPKRDPVYVVLSWIYRNQGKLIEAEQILDKAVEINSECDLVYIGLGQIYNEQKKFTKSEQAFKKAMELNPGNELIYGGLATVYGEMGKDKLCKAYVEKADKLRDNFYNPVTINNYRKLKETLDKRKIKLVCVQYPMRNIQPLKKMLKEDENIIFVDNERIFKDAVREEGYNIYFRDMFGGDFGHCTQKGNKLLADNIAKAILKEIFGK